MVKAMESCGLTDPYMPAEGAPDLKPTDTSSEVSTATGVGSAEYAALENKYKLLQNDAQKLAADLRARENVIDELTMKLTAAEEKLKDRASAKDDFEPHPATLELSEEAKRAKLRRMCNVQSDGTTKVPHDIHLMWKNGGKTERDRLLKIALSSNFDKDVVFNISLAPYTFSRFPQNYTPQNYSSNHHYIIVHLHSLRSSLANLRSLRHPGFYNNPSTRNLKP